jgi:hypothetical protein
MKFTTTTNTTYRRGIGSVPLSWIEYPDKNHIDSIYEYFDNNIRIWDWDVCGDETHDFVFDDGKAFRLEYSWWTDMWAEEDESRMKTEVHVEEIAIEEANVPEKKPGRDWL